MSLVRPGVPPKEAPRGTNARTLLNDYFQTHPGYALTPARLLASYRVAEIGVPSDQCDLFDDLIENDPHLRNLFDQRSQAVAGKPHTVQAGGPDAADGLGAAILDRSLKRLPMVETWEHQLTFNRYGWGATEIDWGELVVDGRTWIVPLWFANVPARRFRIGKQDELRLLTEEYANDGEPLRASKWLVTRRSGTKLARAALMRTGAWFALWKRLAVRDWTVYSEKFGMPFVLAKVLDSTDETSKEVLAELVAGVCDDGGAVIPKGAEIEIKSEGRDGDSSGTHGNLVNFCNREMSKLINGSTLSNDNGDSGGASYALGDVHDAVRWESVCYDAARLEEAFRNQVSVPFCRFNGLDESRAPLLKFQVVRDLNPRQRVDMAEILVNKLGLKISTSQLLHDTGFHQPRGTDDEVPGAPQPAAQGAAA